LQAYIEESVVPDGKIVSMDGFILDLLFGSAHQVANTHLSVLSPIGLHV
jgi:hypothetical protein